MATTVSGGDDLREDTASQGENFEGTSEEDLQCGECDLDQEVDSQKFAFSHFMPTPEEVEQHRIHH